MARLIRSIDTEILRLFDEGAVHGTVHTSIGQEIQDVVLMWSLSQSQDRIFTNHRNHGQALAWGASPLGLLAEILGKESGLVGGYGGSQHIELEGFHSSGVQAGLTGIAVGAGLARKSETGISPITVAVIGDGTLGEGLLYESMNLASVMGAPVLFTVFDNGIAQTTPSHTTTSGDPRIRFRGFGLEVFESNDPSDVTEFRSSAESAIEWVRRERRAAVLYANVIRIGPHSKGDDTRTSEEVERMLTADPFAVVRSQLDSDIARAIDDEIDGLVAEAVEIASSGADSRPRIIQPEWNDDDEIESPFPSGDVRVVESLNAAIHTLLGEYGAIFIGQDLADPYGGAFKVARGITTSYPDQVFSSPISEAAMTGFGLGFALEGTPAIVEMMFGDFVTLAADQIINQASKLPTMYGTFRELNFVLRLPSGGGRGYGPTHSQSLEAMFIGLPNIAIVAPSHRLDSGEFLKRALVRAACPVIFVENKRLYPVREERGEYGVVESSSRLGSLFPTVAWLSMGGVGDLPDVTFITYGGMVPVVESCAKTLTEEEEITTDIFAVGLLSPLDSHALIEAVSATPIIAVVEEGVVEHGFGATVISALAESGKFVDSKFLRIGSESTPIPSAPRLEELVLPDSARIVQQIIALYQAI
ncbi:2-oxoglutarate dehydrogenase [SAR202 cluster bacterium AD-812-D07_MRT_10900m]|nr:2-oxoglutarate dehydrogenase [SAR202 cluster bacterium AD-812-D07_MRT_10900m]